jgi:hypothetical protein
MFLLRKIKNLFFDHPNSLGEGYVMHMLVGLAYSFGLLYASIACLIHSFFPFLFTTTASSIAITIADSSRHRRDDI